MKYVLWIICPLLAGCSPVVMQEPFPDAPLSGNEQKKLTGTWTLDGNDEKDDFTHLYHVAFTSDGKPRVAIIDFENGDFAMKKVPVSITKADDSYYLSVPEDTKDSTETTYIFLEFKPTSQGIVLWIPDKKVFEGLIDAGILEGEHRDGNKKKSLILTTPSTNILELITTEYEVFDYKEPILLKRL